MLAKKNACKKTNLAAGFAFKNPRFSSGYQPSAGLVC
jgi:hypothetical protein